jgi:hypothetical protein
MILLYLKLIACSIIGLGFQLATKNKSLVKSTDRNMIQYDGLKELVARDWRTILGTVATITLLFLFFGQALDPRRMVDKDTPITFFFGYLVASKKIIFEAALSVLFATVGYIGQSFALKIFGVTNRLVDNAIDHKTSIADNAAGTAGTKTPKE